MGSTVPPDKGRGGRHNKERRHDGHWQRHCKEGEEWAPAVPPRREEGKAGTSRTTAGEGRSRGSQCHYAGRAGCAPTVGEERRPRP